MKGLNLDGIRVTNVYLNAKPPVLYTCDLYFGDELGLTIREVRIMETKGVKWIAWPCRPYMFEGEKKYFQFIRLSDRDVEASWRHKLVDLVMSHLEGVPKAGATQASVEQESVPF